MFEIPENLDPLTMGMIMSSGGLKTQQITATIIGLAVKGYLSIEEIKKDSVFSKQDYVFTLQKNDFKSLSFSESKVVNSIFSILSINETVRLSSLENLYYADLSAMKNEIYDYLIEHKVFAPSAIKNFFVPNKAQVNKRILPGIALLRRIILIIIGLAYIFGFIIHPSLPIYAWVCIFAPIPIALVFLYLMPKLTLEGAQLLLDIKGFKLYMETAEKYREQFNEKENIFEKFLPYAILFGLTGKWTRIMKNIYGEKYMTAYHPVWFYGASMTNFNIDTFTSSLNSMTSTMASSLSSSPSSSGSGGGGFSGGGGGGGGGGGW
jgi:uncharacterized membrane protein